jgi:transposase
VNKIICGVDVSKGWLDAHVEPSGAVGRFRNDAAGIGDLAGFCRAGGVELVVMEASGSYERLPFLLLWEAGQPCGIVNARNVRFFAEAMGFLEKTDRIDAAIIARFGEARRVKPTPPPSAAQQRLRALVVRLSQLTDDATVNKQRRNVAADAETIESLDGDHAAEAPAAPARRRDRLADR